MTAKILVVDDDLSVLRSLAESLRFAKYEVDTATSAAAAITDIETNKYDIVIADMWMNQSKTAGLDVLCRTRQLDRFCQVIILTGHGEVSNAVESMRAGAFTYLEKVGSPEESDLLLQQIARAREYRDSLVLAGSELTALADVSTKLADVVSQIEECAALLDTLAGPRRRLFQPLHGDDASQP